MGTDGFFDIVCRTEYIQSRLEFKKLRNGADLVTVQQKSGKYNRKYIIGHKFISQSPILGLRYSN